jgi:hypothetical protein
MKYFLVLLLLFSINVKADDYLIQEMEDLKASLTYDDPARNELTLRLADLYFDVSIQEGADAELTSKRRRSLQLYTDALEGRDGVKKVTGDLRIKVQFQIGRLLEKLGEGKKAVTFFKVVYENPAVTKDLKREAAFQLADWYEKQANFKLTDKYYLSSIKLCNTVESCNYAHFRRGWLLYKETRLDEAITELKQSLWDSKGQVREKVLNDYIMFLSNKMTDGIAELREMEILSKKINKPEIIRQLAESYYTAGNREAGSNLLEFIDRRNPSLYFQVRLLEENYGFRKWDKVNSYISKLSRKDAQDLPKEKEEATEVQKILRRFIVQLDAEVANNPEKKKELRNSIDLYLSFYPNDELRRKMQEGWLKAQTDPKAKIDRLAKWIPEEQKLGTDNKEIRKLRQSRLALAQKEKMSKIVIAESLEIAKIIEAKEAREFEYVAAREMYSQKQYDQALPLFEKLANSAVETGNVDKWGILSQNLVLDIYNNQKRFQDIIAQSTKWTANKSLAQNKELKNEIGQMREIATQAKFEWAAAQGESKEALDTFYSYCMQGTYAKKSCVNAKVLAVKLKDQDKLISLLEKAKDEKTLMSEYELMGRFSDAARLQEKFNLNKKAGIDTYLKISLLYELDYDFKNRDRILTKMIKKIKRSKSIDKKFEKAIYVTLDEANMLNAKALSIPWSLPVKLKLAHRLEVDKPGKKTQKILLSQKESVGPAWSKLILSKLQPYDKRQRKISFYGRRSKYLFQKRTRAIEKLAAQSKKYLEGADIEARVYILDMMQKAYQHFAAQIHATPLPEGLDEATLLQVKEQLAGMAKPFEDVAQDYTRLLNEQLDELTDLAEKQRMQENMAVESPDYASFFILEKTESLNVASLDYTRARELKKSLATDPADIVAMESLERFYKEQKSERIASYFTGRINSLRN